MSMSRRSSKIERVRQQLDDRVGFHGGLTALPPSGQYPRQLGTSPFPGANGDAEPQGSSAPGPTARYVKRDAVTGQFMDMKTSGRAPFKGVRRDK